MTVVARSVLLCALLGAVSLGCRPSLDDRPWLIRDLQIVGVKMDPPEVAPGAAVMAQVIAIAPGGDPDTASTTWALCHLPKPLGENRVAAPGCLVPGPTGAVGGSVELTMPSDACQTFGPNVPQPTPGAPPTRPPDPDVTDGYYQPITTMLGDSAAVALERIHCGLSDASLDVTRAFEAAYVPNQNPSIAGLSLMRDGAPVDSAAVPAGARVSIEVSWTAASAETFPVMDRSTQSLSTAREVLTTSWYVTGGELDRAAYAAPDETTQLAVAGWTAPASPSESELVVVLRDSRGGADARRIALITR